MARRSNNELALVPLDGSSGLYCDAGSLVLSTYVSVRSLRGYEGHARRLARQTFGLGQSFPIARRQQPVIAHLDKAPSAGSGQAFGQHMLLVR